MGEVRVKVKITNVFDEMLARRGQLSPQQVRVYEAEAVVDTGAVSLVLPIFVSEKLGLARPYKQMAVYADGRGDEVDVT